MSGPKRIQLRRSKGWRKPEGAVVVARPTKWGNPFLIGNVVRDDVGRWEPINTRTDAVRAFRDMLGYSDRNYPSEQEIVADLRGRDLACWCPLDQPCHADILLHLANAEEPEA